MTPSGKYRLYIGRLVAVLLFLTSAGFTTVLHYCTMATSTACSLGVPGERGRCHCMASDPVSGPAGQQPAGCRMTAVAGGFIAVQAPLEKELTSVHRLDSHTLYVPGNVVVTPLQYTSFVLVSRYSENVFPLAVEKYVLNETFLI